MRKKFLVKKHSICLFCEGVYVYVHTRAHACICMCNIGINDLGVGKVANTLVNILVFHPGYQSPPIISSE